MITIALPIEQHSRQLDITLQKLQLTKAPYQLDIELDSTINVAEARQKLMDRCKTQYICFIDFDTEIIEADWLEKCLQTMQRTGAWAVFPHEIWGTSGLIVGRKYDPQPMDQDYPIQFGPAACMLVDVMKCQQLKWDTRIGLRNGWLGGDVEEVDYCRRIYKAGGVIYRCHGTAFHHTGGKTDMNKYCGTDRGKTAAIMLQLLDYKYRLCPDNEDFFKALQYIKAKDTNDLMAETGHLRECYHDVIVANGLTKDAGFRQRGLV